MANNLVSKVEIIISCRNLRDADLFSKSDPMAVMFVKHGTKQFVEHGRTEVIMNNLNPDFHKAFLVDYYFEEIQQLKFQIYDIDSGSPSLADHDFLGEFQINLGELVSRANVVANLVGSLARGTILVRCSEIESCKELFTLAFSASELPRTTVGCFFSRRCSPFLEIHRATPGLQFTPGEDQRHVPLSQFVLAHRTEHVSNAGSTVQWRQFQVRNWRLCQGDRDRLLRIDCYHWKRSGNCDLIGYFYSSINDLENHYSDGLPFHIVHPFKQYHTSDPARAMVTKFAVETEHTFIDYISGGCQLQFTVAVDFTASNGPQNNTNSLHYIHPSFPRMQLNQYELAISSVGRIIEDYDYDKWFPALGFGAKIPPNLELSHCFPMTFQDDNPFCHGVDGLLQAYRHSVRQVQLFGPTNFAPCIRHLQRFAEMHRDGSQYFVLLIITDGIITDVDKTVDAIVDSSFLPMSIIIVGVGEEDFSAMTMLDCDNGLLRSGLKVAERDIVQFVPLRDFLSSRESLHNQANLAREVLAELPDQVVSWMRRHNITPNPSPSVSSAPHMMSPPGEASQPHGATGDRHTPPYPLSSPYQSPPYYL